MLLVIEAAGEFRVVSGRVTEVIVESMGKSFIDRLLLPAVISLTTVIFALLILQQLLTQQQGEAESSTKAQALLVKDKIESELKARLLPAPGAFARTLGRSQRA